MTKKTFRSIDAVPWVLPILGTYTGFLAEVGLAVVHVAEVTPVLSILLARRSESSILDNGKEPIYNEDLEAGISKLPEIVGKLEARSNKQAEDEITAQIQELKRYDVLKCLKA